MFKVICIAGDLMPAINPPAGYRCPEIGDIVEVERVVKYAGMDMYQLVEYPPVDGKTFIYDAEAFSPLNGPCEIDIYCEREGERLDAEWSSIVNEYENSL